MAADGSLLVDSKREVAPDSWFEADHERQGAET